MSELTLVPGPQIHSPGSNSNPSHLLLVICANNALELERSSSPPLAKRINAEDPSCLKDKQVENGHVADPLYLHLTLEPHHKHSGSITGGRILFLAEVSIEAAKNTASNPEDQDALFQEAERLAAALVPIAMSGHPRAEGEDVMRFSCHGVPRPSEDLLEHTADAERGGVRLWLLGASVE